MTKRTDSSRSTDSGVGGNAQKSASEIRERAEKIAIRFSGAPDLLWRQKIYRAVLRELTEVRDRAIEQQRAQFANVAEPEAVKSLLSECSRLASRVEELEQVLVQCREALRDNLKMYMYKNEPLMYEAFQAIERVLHGAGAHAEEKS